MERVKNRIVGVLVVMTVLLVVAPSHGAPIIGRVVVTKKSTKKAVQGDKVLAGASGLTIFKKQIRMDIPYRDVGRVQIDRPKNLTQLMKIVSKNPAQAIPALKKITVDYKRMMWDMVAGKALIEAYVTTGKIRDAKVAYAGFVKLYGNELDPRFKVVYVDILVKDGKVDKATDVLEEIIMGGGSAAGQAAAAMKLGDMYSGQGKYREALMHGYFKVIVTYSGVKSVQKDAHKKAVTMLDNLRDARASVIRKRMGG